MRIAVFCATRRGYLFLQKLRELAPEHELVVCSFREAPAEPRYFDDIRDFATARGVSFFEARSTADPKFAAWWLRDPVDLMFTVSWRFLIPAIVYRHAHLGAFVFHDSLLPNYRGFSPTVWSMINGENHTGVTLFAMSDDVDAGDIVDQVSVSIGPDDYIADVLGRVTSSYLDVLERNLARLLVGQAPLRTQDATRATYNCKRTLEDNRIDWHWPTDRIYNLIRAVAKPYPGATTMLHGEPLWIWEAVRVTSPRRFVGRVPGRIIEIHPSEGTVVLTGDGALLLTRVQRANGDIVCAAEILNSFSQTLGNANAV